LENYFDFVNELLFAAALNMKNTFTVKTSLCAGGSVGVMPIWRSHQASGNVARIF
jgi:hypothetical protein